LSVFSLVLYQAALLSDEEELEVLLSHLSPVPKLRPVEEPSFDQLEKFLEDGYGYAESFQELNSLEGLALAVEANQRRIEMDFRGAEILFERAFGFAASGVYAPWLAVRLLDLRASLWVETGAFAKASRDLQRAKALGGDFRVEWHLGLVNQLEGDHALACQYFANASAGCPEELRPALDLAVAYSNACLGQSAHARQLLDGVRFPDSYSDAAKATWVRGLAAKELDWPAALPLMEAAHAMFGLLEDPQCTALTAIDIAAEYAEQGDYAQLRDTAAAAYSILLGLGAEPQAIGAFSVMAQAEMCRLDVAALRKTLVQALARKAVPN
jgi:hypothetical protein